MKVLKEGKPNGWEIEQVCSGRGNGDGGCEALLLVNADDIFITTASSYDGSREYYYTFKCPRCGICTDIPDKDIPNSVKQKALDNKK